MDDVVTGYDSDAGTNMADYTCSNLTATASKSLANSTHSGSSDPYVIAIQSAATWLYGWQPQLAPNILTNPAPQTVTAGQSGTLTVSATGIPAPTYQWQHAGTNLPGAVSSTLTIASTTTNNAGTYSVIVTSSGGSVSSSSATLTVNPLAITVMADAQSKTYGATDPILTYQYSPALLAGDSFSGALSRTAGENVGVYAITQGSLNLNANYTLNYIGANLTVTPASLTITASNQSKVYGQNLIFAGTEFSVNGLTNGDTVSSVTLVSAGATNTAPVNTYSIAPSAAVGADLGNYNINYSNGVLTVGQANAFVGASSSENPSGYKDAVSFLATLPADANGNVVFSSANGAFSTNALSSGSTTSLSLTNLPRGTNVIFFAYAGDVNYLGSTNTLNQIVTNHPPVANNLSYTRNAAVNSFKMLVSDLLTNATDTDGDSLSLAFVSPTTNNALITVASGYVMYYNTNAVPDQFTYTVSDGYGGTNNATVSIAIDSTPLFGQSQVASTSNGTATLSFAGIPGFSYNVSRSVDLLDGWTVIWTTNAPANGTFKFTDTNAPSPTAFYRLQYNP